ncbi:hypothetical protein FS837_005660 [Tulasnella sp. UAMH 9824]|nr:hypothetical protein FS837_005660 [Tulasnella sp. UAMH 9824]
MPPTDGDSNAPVAALSLLSLAASSSTSQPRSVPRAAPTTSISRSSQQPPAAPATTALTAPPPVGSASTPISPPLSSTSPTFTNAAIRVVPAHTNARGMTASATQPKARRLSSASQTKRRLSEATAATIQASAADDLIRGTSVVSNSGLTAAAASLSLSTSPPTTTPPVRSVQQLIQKQSSDASGDGNDEDSAPNTGSGRKKGVIYRCETCSKVYRHPNCLLKHRWEHSPAWREASKFLLSKHQQVQLLEAAAILSHITPREESAGAGTSLPDDRALWPSYLSGGLLAAPSTKVPAPGAKGSNLTVTKVRGASGPWGSNTPVKQEDSSEEGSEPSDSAQGPSKGVSAMSLPTTSTLSFRPRPPVTDNAAKRSPSPNASSGTFGADGESGFYYGSIGAIPTQPLSPTSPLDHSFRFGGNSQSFQSSFAMQPPYARGGAAVSTSHRPGHHRHTRTSSSVSSSYTRSSIRGGMEEEDDMMDDDYDDVGYLDKASAFSYGSVGTYPTSVSPSLASGRGAVNGAKRRSNGDTSDFDILDERDEADDSLDVDEESDEHQGGAGMPINMDMD